MGLGVKGVSLSALPLRFSTREVSAVDITEDASIFDVFDDAANASEQAVLGDLREHISHVLSAKQMSDGEGRAIDSLTSFAAVSALGANMLVMMFPPRFPRRPATRLDKRKPAFMRVF